MIHYKVYIHSCRWFHKKLAVVSYGSCVSNECTNDPLMSQVLRDVSRVLLEKGSSELYDTTPIMWKWGLLGEP